MTTIRTRLARPYPTDRISAHECKIDKFGKPMVGRYVKNGGWYGMFSAKRLRDELMPKLAEYSHKGYSYPFLITTYQLENEAEAVIAPSHRKRRVKLSEIFSRRQRKSPKTPVAVILSPTEFRLLS